jgi:hypothetical protein
MLGEYYEAGLEELDLPAALLSGIMKLTGLFASFTLNGWLEAGCM